MKLNKMGDINVFSGPMKCGKSEQIINEFTKHQIAGKKAMMFKPKIDDRAGETLVASRNGRKINAINIEKIEELEDYDTDVFFIDEFQFLKGNIDTIENLATKGKKFYIAGLNLTAEKKPFGKMGELLCISDNVKMMTSICEVCKNDNAIFSYYKGKKNCDIEIGDAKYIPVCRHCYEKLNKGNTIFY